MPEPRLEDSAFADHIPPDQRQTQGPTTQPEVSDGLLPVDPQGINCPTCGQWVGAVGHTH